MKIGAEQSELHLGEEEFLRRGVDHLDRRIDSGGEPVGPEQEIVDRLGELEADEKGDEDREQRPDQPAPELDQMLDQRRLGGVDVLMASRLGSALRLAGSRPSLALVASAERGLGRSGLGLGGALSLGGPWSRGFG